MDPERAEAISHFFDQLFNFFFAMIGVPIFLVVLIGSFILYQVYKPSRQDKIENWLDQKLASVPTKKQSQRSAIRTISLMFFELIKHYNFLGHHNLSFDAIETSIDKVTKICQEHALPFEIVEHYITACISLVNTDKYAPIHLKLTTKFNR